MRIGRRAALIAIGVVLALAGVLGWIAYLAETRSDRLLGIASRTLGREVHADRIGFLLGRSVGVGLWGVRVADEPPFATDQPFAAARQAELRVRLGPLLHSQLVVDRAVIVEPEVHLVRTADGKLNFDFLRDQAKHHRPKKGAAEPDESKSSGPAFQLALLALRDGTISFEDQETHRTLVVRDFGFEAEQPVMGAPMPVTVHARIETPDVRVNGIESEGTFDLTSEGAWYGGDIRAESGAIGPFTLGEASANIQLRPPSVMVQSIKVAVLGGRVTGWFRMQSGGEGEGFRSEIDGRDLALEQLPLDEGRPRPAGKMAVHVSLSGAVPGAGDFLPALRGSGRFEVADGKIVNLRLGSALREVLGPFLGADKAERMRTKYPDLFGSDDLPFTVLSGSGTVGQGRVHSEDFVLAGASFQARGSGSVGFDGQLDTNVKLLVSPALTDDILGKSSARPALVDDQGRLAVPLHIGGTIERPHVTPDPVFVGQAAAAVLGGPGLKDLANDVMQKMLGGKKKHRSK